MKKLYILFICLSVAVFICFNITLNPLEYLQNVISDLPNWQEIFTSFSTSISNVKSNFSSGNIFEQVIGVGQFLYAVIKVPIDIIIALINTIGAFIPIL